MLFLKCAKEMHYARLLVAKDWERNEADRKVRNWSDNTSTRQSKPTYCRNFVFSTGQYIFFWLGYGCWQLGLWYGVYSHVVVFEVNNYGSMWSHPPLLFQKLAFHHIISMENISNFEAFTDMDRRKTMSKAKEALMKAYFPHRA